MMQKETLASGGRVRVWLKRATHSRKRFKKKRKCKEEQRVIGATAQHNLGESHPMHCIRFVARLVTVYTM